ncbi:collagen alpha-1(I) chain-like [Manacus candei]|uniref:collagen alpha-1(I) chain-like n=1 Tax=Manacus candei TaxID=415023 RepID=UPI002227BEAE|nr:collagen alpha-1(I) chain-like [Manacus candei]
MENREVWDGKPTPQSGRSYPGIPGAQGSIPRKSLPPHHTSELREEMGVADMENRVVWDGKPTLQSGRSHPGIPGAQGFIPSKFPPLHPTSELQEEMGMAGLEKGVVWDGKSTRGAQGFIPRKFPLPHPTSELRGEMGTAGNRDGSPGRTCTPELHPEQIPPFPSHVGAPGGDGSGWHGKSGSLGWKTHPAEREIPPRDPGSSGVHPEKIPSSLSHVRAPGGDGNGWHGKSGSLGWKTHPWNSGIHPEKIPPSPSHVGAPGEDGNGREQGWELGKNLHSRAPSRANPPFPAPSQIPNPPGSAASCNPAWKFQPLGDAGNFSRPRFPGGRSTSGRIGSEGF